VYFNVNFNVFFKLIKVNLLVSELYIYQNARCNDKKENINVAGMVCLSVRPSVWNNSAATCCFNKI